MSDIVIKHDDPIYDQFKKDADKLYYVAARSNGKNIPYIPDISSLKKQIKYSKNPMEKKRLERELNMAYKEIKNV